MSWRPACCGAVVAVLVSALSACGGVNKTAVVVHVDGRAITEGEVDHWASVIKLGGGFAGSRGEAARAGSKQRALALLISSNALVGQAVARGLTVPTDAVELALTEREAQEGARQFRARLNATGQTLADVKLEIRAELALDAIRQDLERRATRVTQREVAAYYAGNRRLFRAPELRVVDFVETLPSRAAALALIKHIGAGRRFAEVGFREKVPRPLAATGRPDKIRLVNAIFAARPGVASSPLRFFSAWTVFVVRKIIPPHGPSRPLAEVRSEVAERLVAVRRDDIAAQLDAEYKERWFAKTRCRAGYVAPGCAQYHGPVGSYEDPFASWLNSAS
jgi:hypothetical protein